MSLRREGGSGPAHGTRICAPTSARRVQLSSGSSYPIGYAALVAFRMSARLASVLRHVSDIGRKAAPDFCTPSRDKSCTARRRQGVGGLPCIIRSSNKRKAANKET